MANLAGNPPIYIRIPFPMASRIYMRNIFGSSKYCSPKRKLKGLYLTSRFKKSIDTGTTRSIRIHLELDRDETDIRHDTTPNSAINPKKSDNSAEMPSYLGRLDQFTEKKEKHDFSFS